MCVFQAAECSKIDGSSIPHLKAYSALQTHSYGFRGGIPIFIHYMREEVGKGEGDGKDEKEVNICFGLKPLN